MVVRAVVLICLMFMAFPVGAACNKKNPPPVNLSDYYSRASGKTGEVLKSALNSIIKGHKRFDYTPCVWEILKEADEDPNNSNNVIALYTGRSILSRVGFVAATIRTPGIENMSGPNPTALKTKTNTPTPMPIIFAQRMFRSTAIAAITILTMAVYLTMNALNVAKGRVPGKLQMWSKATLPE